MQTRTHAQTQTRTLLLPHDPPSPPLLFHPPLSWTWRRAANDIHLAHRLERRQRPFVEREIKWSGRGKMGFERGERGRGGERNQVGGKAVVTWRDRHREKGDRERRQGEKKESQTEKESD